ncbi:MAG TPA: hypothetical protein PLJ34_07835, partial [Hyphomicrobiales bacterium]|nr:hypothetical protein [Hyphomicrobiales bacterium]
LEPDHLFHLSMASGGQIARVRVNASLTLTAPARLHESRSGYQSVNVSGNSFGWSLSGSDDGRFVP